MIIYKDDIWTIYTKSKNIPLMTVEEGYFTTVNNDFHSNTVYAEYIRHDARGALLPREQWYVSIPYSEVIQVTGNGQYLYWTVTPEGLMNPYE